MGEKKLDVVAFFGGGWGKYRVCILYTSAWIWAYDDATLLPVLSECSGFQCDLQVCYGIFGPKLH